MYRSCPLVQNFAKQGLKIRIRKESGPRPSRYTSSKRKNIRKASHTSEEEEEDEEEEEEFEELEDEYPPSKNNKDEDNIQMTTPSSISNKRRLSLSYLLDYNETNNIPRKTISSTNSIDHYKLAPLSSPSTTTTTNYHSNSKLYDDHSIDLPPIQRHFNLPPIQQHFHFHRNKQQY